jgi:hypothetical protein
MSVRCKWSADLTRNGFQPSRKIRFSDFSLSYGERSGITLGEIVLCH